MPDNHKRISRSCQILAIAARGLTVTLAIILFAGCGDADIGEACGEVSPHIIKDCAGGLYCAYDGTGDHGVCRARSQEGELCLGPTAAPPCASGLVCNAVHSPPTCARPAEQRGPCVQNADCAAGLVCTSMTGVIGTCEPP